MPNVVFAASALRDLERLRNFLKPKNRQAAQRAGEAILKDLQILRLQPQIGRPIADLPGEFREHLIDFGNSGYIARYHYAGDRVVILAIRHQREAGFD